MKVMIEVSARHVHLSEKDAKTLFGYIPKKLRDLSQPGQFLCSERVKIIGLKSEIDGVAVLGPCRSKTQVEISFTDSLKLGINAPVRESGNLENTPGCILVGPNGKISLSEGVIVSKRHIHLDETDSKKFGIKDGKILKVCVKSKNRSLIFDDVVARVKDSFCLSMHIDTDEANACGYEKGMLGDVIL